MTITRLVLRSARYHWRTNLAVLLGVATAVAVLAGALLVGDSVRGSLRELALGRLGRTASVLTLPSFAREEIAAQLAASGASAAPIVATTGSVTHEGGRRAAGVHVYGVDERFWAFHGLPPAGGVLVSPALARELAASPGDAVVVQLQRPSEIPLESLFGRRDEIERRVRLTLAGVLPRERLGEFVLQPQQAEVRSLFLPLRRVQRDLGVTGEVNTILLDAEVAAADLLGGLSLEDLGVKVRYLDSARAVSVETTSGVLDADLQQAATGVAARMGLRPTPVFTYLANAIRAAGGPGAREIPYSLVTAIDLTRLPGATAGGDGIVLNEWAARELKIAAGGRVEIDFFLWDPASGLQTKTHSFSVQRVVPIEGLAADRELAPDYPGITGAESLADWDPPFPLDLSRVRPADDAYWDSYRTTPKAFIPYERGRELWSTRYGAATSIRIDAPADRDPASLLQRIRDELRRAIHPRALGAAVVPVRRAATAASVGATDFGEYFTYFSFFLVASALLLAVLFFRLGVEQRLKQIGVLRAAGFAIARIRRLLLVEAVLIAAVGSAVGIAGAIGYAHLIVHGLRTWWVGAVGTTLLDVHVSWPSLAIGAAGGVVAAAACVWLSLRAVARLSPRALLTASSIDAGAVASPARSRRSRRIAYLLGLLGLAAIAVAFVDRDAQAGAFFAAGAALLAAGMFFLAGWLRAREARVLAGRGAWPTARLGFRSASFRPARSVLSAALIASAAFIVVAVDAFRKGGGEIAGDRRSGTGGYVLLGRSQLPIVQNPNVPATLDLSPDQIGAARFTRFRVRAGDDASCLNLYRPTNPTIVAPEPGFIESGRFSFSASMAETDAERENPWLLLRRELPDGAVPAIADATSLQYVLHAAVGDEFTIDAGAGEPLRLRFVAALSDSVLQGELVIAEEEFVRRFPSHEGYRMFLIDAPGVETPDEANALVASLERALEPFGFDAVTAAERLAAFHRVENTYLSTFQALGGLGLLLGTIGLATILFRNVLERRRELALLRAVGYDSRRLSLMIVAEAAFVLAVGLATGAACAALAIAPAWLGRSGTLPGAGVAGLLGGVAVAGLVSSVVATRAALRGNMLAALRAE